jgi:hypothetical protein
VSSACFLLNKVKAAKIAVKQTNLPKKFSGNMEIPTSRNQNSEGMRHLQIM